VIAEDVAELVKLFEQSDLTELSLEQNGRKLFLRKGEVTVSTPVVENEPEEPPLLDVTAQLVGVFLWNKERTGKPSVAVHQRVEKGQLLGVIEALGILNDVEAPEAGEVSEIHVAGGQPVEYGQPLISLTPA
jgi:acetyl-CoA carboxylase biotin carboxyl carrier protein